MRTIEFGRSGEDAPGGVTQKFCNNKIVSSRYTILTFIPKNLFEQFHRMVNFFFLTLLVLQMAIDIPVNPIPYAAAFFVVIGVTALKQGYEDFRRHRADKKLNRAERQILTSKSEIQSIASEKLKVGDIVVLSEEEDVPCDLLLVACQSKANEGPQGFCQITTANLDGETNLKVRFCPKPFNGFLNEVSGKPESGVNNLALTITYEDPNSNLYNFSGKIVGKDKDGNVADFKLDSENVLLRGSRIKNNYRVYGMIIYTGKETRLSMNSKQHSGKFSTIEHAMNKVVIGMFLFLVLMSSISLVLSFHYRNTNFDSLWYVRGESQSDADYGIMIFFSYMVLLCYLIPVSLPVTIELQKFGCSQYFSMDKDMTTEDGMLPWCNTSDLNEELGQVQFLLTDKTGTLTENELVFKYASINAKTYKATSHQSSQPLDQGKTANKSTAATVDENGNNFEANANEENSDREMEISEYLKTEAFTAELDFFRALALCHSVRTVDGDSNKSDENIQYQASSVDEETLVRFAASCGVKLIDSQRHNITLKELNTLRQFKIVTVLEFDSERKCMSVITEDENGTFTLWCKGAESALFPRFSSASAHLIQPTEEHVTNFAKMGLRTMVIAKRSLDVQSLTQLLDHLEAAGQNQSERQNAYKIVESELEILGATGVEDRLQEGVAETLNALKKAGLRIGVLTGDKLETALSVSISCGLVPEQSQMVILQGSSDVAYLESSVKRLSCQGEDLSNCVAVIDGEALSYLFEHWKKSLQQLLLTCGTLIICRMEPKQKSQVVQLVKSAKNAPKTCTVGDGGNDCGMLREAHVGIGIMGREGLQAAREADFAISKFRFLQTALFVHGGWNYRRLSSLVTYFFYRGTVFIGPIFFYGFLTGFSANTTYDSTYVMMFSLAFTSTPVLWQGLTDQHFPKESLLSHPELYKENSGNKKMGPKAIFPWIITGIWQSLLIFYLPKYLWVDSHALYDYGAFSLLIGLCLVMVVNVKVLMYSRFYTWMTLFTELISFVFYLAFYSLLCHAGSGITGVLAYSLFPLLRTPQTWVILLNVLVLSVLPELTFYGICDLLDTRRRK